MRHSCCLVMGAWLAFGLAAARGESHVLGKLRAPDVEQARAQAWKWLEATGKPDVRRPFEEIWDNEKASLLERVADTLALGDAEAAALLREASDPSSAAPTETPALLYQIGKETGAGDVSPRRLQGLAQQWGAFPPKERIRVIQDLTRDMPPAYREVIVNYFKKLAQQS